MTEGTTEKIPQQLNDNPDFRFINKYVRRKVCGDGASTWQDLGIALMGGDAVIDLQIIRRDHPNDIVVCCSEMFTLWLERTPTASWKQLIEALKEVQLIQLASELEELLKPSVECSVGQEGKTSEQQSLPLQGSKVTDLKDDLKYYYLNVMDRSQCTRWPQLGDPNFYLDVTIARAKYLYQMKEKDVSLKMERFCEEYAMGLVNEDDATIEKILDNGKGKVTLIEGDPGCGKTTLTLRICKRWAEGELLVDNVLISIPLRCYELAANTNDLFKVIEKLGCPVPAGMKEYVQQNKGKGLVWILDGWDELPNQLQVESLFSDIVFKKNTMFFYSTIIVTSRPSCSESIAKVVQQRKAHYQILGFSPHNAELYIKHYFNDLQSAELLIALKGREYLRRHFYIPITVAIMCYVYNDKGEIPETLSKLYEDFVRLYICSNLPDTCRKDFNTLTNVPEVFKPIFGKLCKTAYDMLRDQKLVFDEGTLGITHDDLMIPDLGLKQFDGFGLLHVQSFSTTQATTKKYYSFIHRAVQELLAAICIMNTGNISDVLDRHFYVNSYLINIFPFLFGLMSEKQCIPLAGKLAQIFSKPGNYRSKELLSSILYCLFEAHNVILCRQFGQVFSDKKDFNPSLRTFLECHYAYYFLSVCGCEELNVSFVHNIVLPASKNDLCLERMAEYLQRSTNLFSSSSFNCTINRLSQEGMSHLGKVISTQRNLHSLTIECNDTCQPGCIKRLCDSIPKGSPFKSLTLPLSASNTDDLESVGLVIQSSLKRLYLRSFSPYDYGVCYYHGQQISTFPEVFMKALHETKILEKLWLPRWKLSEADSEAFCGIISQNCSLKELIITVATAKCLSHIINGLTSNKSIATFRTWPFPLPDIDDKARPSDFALSDSLGEDLRHCFTRNCNLKSVDFTASSFGTPALYIPWSSTQVSSICTGLRVNTSVVSLDISGCYIDTEACDAVCGMLSQNTTLQHLFLNPVHLEKQEAIAMIGSCRANITIKLLSLVQWPPKEGKTSYFKFSRDEDVLQKIQQHPILHVYWKWDVNSRKLKNITF